MNVKQLIKKLQEYDPKLPVISSGYEGGYLDIDTVLKQKIALNVNTEWYYGPHEAENNYSIKDDLDKYTIVDAVFIG